MCEHIDLQVTADVQDCVNVCGFSVMLSIAEVSVLPTDGKDGYFGSAQHGE